MTAASVLTYLVLGILFLLLWTKDDNEPYEDYLGTCLLVVVLWPFIMYLLISGKL